MTGGAAVDLDDPRLPARFWAKVYPEPNTGCWLWGGGLAGSGYGSITVGGTVHSAHRLAYLTLVGPIADGLTLDHLCRTRPCVYPSHLEPVTNRENILRSPLMGSKSHCVHGHLYTAENTIWKRRGGPYARRLCRICACESDRRRYHAKTPAK